MIKLRNTALSHPGATLVSRFIRETTGDVADEG
jgi:hypothetical protein